MFHQAYEDATTSEAFKKGKEVTEEVYPTQNICILVSVLRPVVGTYSK